MAGLGWGVELVGERVKGAQDVGKKTGKQHALPVMPLGLD